MKNENNTLTACKPDDQTEYINKIIGNFEYIKKDINKVQKLLGDSPQNKLRSFENISKSRLYAKEIRECADWIIKQTVQLEEDIIIWGDSRNENLTDST